MARRIPNTQNAFRKCNISTSHAIPPNHNNYNSPDTISKCTGDWTREFSHSIWPVPGVQGFNYIKQSSITARTNEFQLVLGRLRLLPLNPPPPFCHHRTNSRAVLCLAFERSNIPESSGLDPLRDAREKVVENISFVRFSAIVNSKVSFVLFCAKRCFRFDLYAY